MKIIDLVLKGGYEIGYPNDQSRGFLCDKKTNEPVIELQETHSGVSNGYVVYKKVIEFSEGQNLHLNLPLNRTWHGYDVNPQIGAAVDGDYIYVQYLRYSGPAWNPSQKWTMRKYKYK